MAGAVIFVAVVCIYLGLYALSGKWDRGSGGIVLRVSKAPSEVEEILRGAAAELGGIAESIDPPGPGPNLALLLHGADGESARGIWAVQVLVRGGRRGSFVELTALGESLEHSEMYSSSRRRADGIADRLRK